MLKLALVGKNIQHSLSKQMYEKLRSEEVDYTLLDYSNPKEIPKAKALLDTFQGISITSPYKEHFLSELDTNFSPVLGVNVLRRVNHKIEGTNTDYLAVNEIISQYLIGGPSEIYIIGDGVMAKLTIYILDMMKKDYVQVSRKKNNFNVLFEEVVGKARLVINTCAREYCYAGLLTKKIKFWDMNYNLDHHSRLFENTSVHYIDGTHQLELQAKYALSFWNLTNR